MPYQEIKGDLLAADVEYIVQQNSCTACKGQGLSAAIAKEFGVDPYAQRKCYKGSWATAETRSEPGTLALYPLEGGSGPLKGILCAFAQVAHGKPAGDPKAVKDPLGLVKDDSPKDRLNYFHECLAGIATLEPASVGFPYKIGCGLAGGSWPDYKEALQTWAKENPSISVKVYRLD